MTSPRRNYGGSPERPGARRIGVGLMAALTVVVAAIIVAVVLLVTSGGSGKHHAQAATNTTVASKKHAGAGAKAAGVKINPANVTVAVLNGTMTSNLAADVSSKLGDKGFKQGPTTNATDQATQTTVVGYVPAAPNAKNDAYAVALALGLKQSAVKPVSSANQTVACSGATTNCPDQVVVTVGADLNSDAT